MRYTKELLEPLIKTSFTMSEVVRKLGHRTDTGFVTYLNKVAKKFNIDITHFKNKSEQARDRSVIRNINDYLSNKNEISSCKLKNKLFLLNIKDKKCEKCGIDKWLGEELTLHLHHIDLNHTNNNLSNLMILCPNCHSLAHRSKKIKEKPVNKKRKCKLRPLSRKVVRPDFLTLKKELKESNYCAVARKYNVSDNCVRKWVKMYNKHKE